MLPVVYLAVVIGPVVWGAGVAVLRRFDFVTTPPLHLRIALLFGCGAGGVLGAVGDLVDFPSPGLDVAFVIGRTIGQAVAVMLIGLVPTLLGWWIWNLGSKARAAATQARDLSSHFD
jgi:hypothetical protein